MSNKRRRCDLTGCEEKYRQTRSDRLYCSDKCRNIAHRQRKAEESENGRPSAESNGHNRVSYAEAYRRAAEKPLEPSTDEPGAGEPRKSHAEELDELLNKVYGGEWPKGRSFRAPPPPPPTDDGPYVITIDNIPTRFPGTPLSRGRQG